MPRCDTAGHVGPFANWRPPPKLYTSQAFTPSMSRGQKRIVQVLVADCHPMFREMLRSVIAEALPSPSFLEVETFAEAKDVVSQCDHLGLALLDLTLAGIEGLTGVLRLSILRPSVPFMVVAALDSPDLMRRALVCGAAGFLSKSLAREQMWAEIQVSAGRTAPHQGENGERLDCLTIRERMVLEAMVRGRSNKQIAYELQITYTTVKVHVSSILRKLRVRSRIQAIIATRDRCSTDGS